MFTVDDTCDKKNRHYNLKSSPEQLTSLTTRREMTSVFREIPCLREGQQLKITNKSFQIAGNTVQFSQMPIHWKSSY